MVTKLEQDHQVFQFPSGRDKVSQLTTGAFSISTKVSTFLFLHFITKLLMTLNAKAQWR